MAMSFFFKIKGDPNWKESTTYFYNGAINEIQEAHNSEEIKWLGAVWKDTAGQELKTHEWVNNVPVYIRVFGVLRPGSQNDAILNALNKIQEELAKAVD